MQKNHCNSICLIILRQFWGLEIWNNVDCCNFIYKHLSSNVQHFAGLGNWQWDKSLLDWNVQDVVGQRNWQCLRSEFEVQILPGWESTKPDGLSVLVSGNIFHMTLESTIPSQISMSQKNLFSRSGIYCSDCQTLILIWYGLVLQSTFCIIKKELMRQK